MPIQTALVSTRRECLATMAGCLMVPRSARGQLAGRHVLRADYGMYTSGLHVAEVELARESEDARLVGMSFAMKNRGVAALFGGRHRIWLNAEYGRDGIEQPRSFTWFNEKPDRNRRITIIYDDAGAIGEVTVDNDGRTRDSRAPRELWVDAVDPLTGLARLQDWAHSAQPDEDNFRAALFNGRKRADLTATKRGRSSLDLVLHAIFGFDEDDPFVSWPGQAPNVLALDLDDGEPPMPQRLIVGSSGLRSELVLEDRHASTL